MAGDLSSFDGFPPHWPIMRLGEVAEIKSGKRLPLGTSLTTERTLHPYLRIVDFKDGRIDRSNLMYVPDDVFPLIQRYVISPEDLYISIVGTVGLVGIIDADLDGANLTENAAKICNLKPNIDRDYLRFYLTSPWGRHQIYSRTVGSTQPKLALFRIEQIELPLPTLPEQCAIAGVLAALDDKIESNRRASRMLERVARAMFRAWFVDFEPVKAKAAGARYFPGMSQEVFDVLPTRLVESELGPAPEGWGVLPLDEAMEVNPSRRLAKGIPAPYLDMALMPTDGHAPATWAEREAGSGARFMNGDTLVARITPCLENGKTAYVDFLSEGQVAWGSTEYIVLRPKPPIPNLYAYLLARTPEFRAFAIKNMTGTSGRQRVPFSTMSKFNVAVGPLSVMKAFGEAVGLLFSRSSAGVRESRSLAALCDYLLPKLLSGEIRVRET